MLLIYHIPGNTHREHGKIWSKDCTIKYEEYSQHTMSMLKVMCSIVHVFLAELNYIK